ncbi:MAG: glycosyltransferase, partial [bacterium]
VSQLPKYYWVADIGVWPSEESMSQLDASACGLPLVLSDKIEVLERIEGNGYLYKQGDFNDLSLKLLKLQDTETRIKFGIYGSNKVEQNYSWNSIAKIRESYYLGEI